MCNTLDNDTLKVYLMCNTLDKDMLKVYLMCNTLDNDTLKVYLMCSTLDNDTLKVYLMCNTLTNVVTSCVTLSTSIYFNINKMQSMYTNTSIPRYEFNNLLIINFCTLQVYSLKYASHRVLLI